MKEPSGKQRWALNQRVSFGSSCLLGWTLVRRKGAAVGRAAWYNTVMNLPGLYPIKWRWKRFEGSLRSLPGWVWLTLGKCHWWQVPWHKLLNELGWMGTKVTILHTWANLKDTSVQKTTASFSWFKRNFTSCSQTARRLLQQTLI